MSATRATASPPIDAMEDIVSARCRLVLEHSTTFAPSRANNSAVARPIPRPAPVISATLELRDLPVGDWSIVCAAYKWNGLRRNKKRRAGLFTVRIEKQISSHYDGGR